MQARVRSPHVTLPYDERGIPRSPVEAVAWRPVEFRRVRSFVGRDKHVTLGRWTLRSWLERAVG